MSGHVEYAAVVEELATPNGVHILTAGWRDRTFVYVRCDAINRYREFEYKNSILNTHGGYARALNEVKTKVTQWMQELRDSCIEEQIKKTEG